MEQGEKTPGLFEFRKTVSEFKHLGQRKNKLQEQYSKLLNGKHSLNKKEKIAENLEKIQRIQRRLFLKILAGGGIISSVAMASGIIISKLLETADENEMSSLKIQEKFGI